MFVFAINFKGRGRSFVNGLFTGNIIGRRIEFVIYIYIYFFFFLNDNFHVVVTIISGNFIILNNKDSLAIKLKTGG
jgi:hypothetical protein